MHYLNEPRPLGSRAWLVIRLQKRKLRAALGVYAARWLRLLLIQRSKGFHSSQSRSAR